MRAPQAFNACLKPLEEPPEYAVFLLATTDPQKLPATVLSRCQRYDFRWIPLDVIAARLREVLEQEGVRAREDALRAIARRAEGGMRDALSIADQCVSFFPDEELTDAHVLEVLGAAGTDVYRRMLRSAAEGDAASLLMSFDALLMDGKDVRQIISDFTWYLRGLLLFKASGGSEGIEELAGEDRDALLADCADLHEEQLMYYIEQLSDLSNSLRNAGNRRTLTEITLITLCRPQARPQADGSVLARLDRIEKQLEQGIFTAAPASSGSASGSPEGGAADAVFGTGEDSGLSAGSGGTDPAEEELPAEIAPELFQKIAQQWDATVSSMKEIGWGKLLAECSTPLFEKGDAGTLYIRVDDVWLRAFQNNERAARMAEEAIEKRFHTRIRVKFVGARDAKDGGRLSAIASAVKDLEADIRFPVDLEDGEE
jgi:DNA polymerase-3 subunit gamma/tau